MIRKLHYLMCPAGDGGTGATAEIEPLSIDFQADATTTLKGIGSRLNSLVEFANDQKRRAKDGKVADPEVLNRLDTELRTIGPKITELEKNLNAATSRWTGAESDEVILSQACMALETDEDLPQMSRAYYNLVGLRSQEITGIAQLGQRAAHGTVLEKFAGNPQLARSAALVDRFQYLNDRLKMKDEILALVKQSYRNLGTPAERMKTLREYPEYVKVGEQLQRALGNVAGSGSSGGFLVPVILSSQVGDMVEAQYVVAQLFQRFTMTSKSFEWPFRRSRATAYHIADNDPVDDDPNANFVTASQQTFGKPVWTAQRLADFTYVANDVDEDSIESVTGLAIEDLAIVLGQAVEFGIINGEYKASTMDGSTFNIAGGPGRWCGGLRYNALMTASYTASVAAAAALSFTHGLTLLAAMKAWGAAAPVSDTAWITGYEGWRNLFLVNAGDSRYFMTNQNYGAGAPLLTGQIGTFLGRPVVLSATMPATHTDGKVNATASNNIKGTILCVNRRRYAIGDRRAIEVEQSQHVAFRKFQNALRGSVRLDFESMDSDHANTGFLATGATPVGVIYGLT